MSKEQRIEGAVSTFDPNRLTGTVRLSGAMTTCQFTFDHYKGRYAPRPGQKVEVVLKADGSVDQVWPVRAP